MHWKVHNCSTLIMNEGKGQMTQLVASHYTAQAPTSEAPRDPQSSHSRSSCPYKKEGASIGVYGLVNLQGRSFSREYWSFLL